MTKTISTGIQGLDQVLHGGLPPDHMYLVAGSPGTGKTTLALQFLLEGIRCGERALYVTLSQSKKELLDVADSHGWSLDELVIYDQLGPEKREVNRYTMFHPSELELAEITDAFLDEVKRIKPQRLIFDSVSEMRLLAQDSLRFRREILALKQFFEGLSCTVWLLDDYTSAGTDPQLEGIAHGVITLDFDNPGYGSPRRHLRVVKLRGAEFTGGYHDFTIKSGGMDVFPRLDVAGRELSETQTFKSGISALDGLLGGGLNAGTAALLIGPAGVGKSTMAAQYVFAAVQQGHKAAYFSFDEGRSIMLSRTAGVGINLKGQAASGDLLLQQIDPDEMSPGEFSHVVRQSVEAHGAEIVVIDSLNGYHQAMPEARFLNAHINDLLSYLSQHTVMTILVVGQHGMFGAGTTTPIDLSYMADTVILLRYFENGGEVRQAISISKKRTGNHERSIREFRITSSGLQVGEPLKAFQGILTGVPRLVESKSHFAEAVNAGAEKQSA
jgi:circadian clock protein KaiC